MDEQFACEDAEELEERMLRVENALFFLKAKSACFACWDNTEVERLEALRVKLLARQERLCQRDGLVAG